MTTAYSAAEIGALLRSHEASAVEIVSAALARIEQEEARLNAFITVTGDRAVREARAVDAAIARGEDLGPLMGVPWAIKDVFAAEGAPTTGGSRALRDHRPPGDAAIVSRMTRGGAVLVGKTNLHELGWGLSPQIGRTNNPHDLALGSGGSSGGSAATVACGAVPVAIGTDGGGSIRMPAAYCAVVGFKPTHGRISVAGHLPGAWTVGDAGPIARSVGDVATTFAALSPAGRMPSDPGAALRAGVVAGGTDGASDEILAAYTGAIAALRRSCHLDEVELDLAGAFSAWAVTFAAELSTALRRWLGPRLGETSPELQEIVAQGEGIPAVAYLRAQRLRTRLFRQIETALASRDVLVTPAVLSPPPRDEAYWKTDDDSTGNSWLSLLNLTGHPALVLPIGRPGSGASVQLIGPYGADEGLLAAASRVEAALAQPPAAPRRS